jgi:galactose mutarotase-like enzyme
MNTPPADSSAWIRIASPQLAACIDPLGAQLSSLRDEAGRELLWGGDAAIWSGRAPLLFPIVGSLAGGQYRLGAHTYALGRHGFARGRHFELQAKDPAVATFALQADDATLAVYPFRFILLARFAVAGPALEVTMEVRNTGEVDLPASMGFHPAFLWPLPGAGPRAAHVIEFQADEPAPVRRIDAQGLLTPTLHPTPVKHGRLQLDDALFRDDVLILDAPRSRRLIYGADAGPGLEVGFPDARYLGIWTRPGAPFLCIEPWQGITDPEGFAADFRHKPGVFSVAPGASRTLTMTLTLL